MGRTCTHIQQFIHGQMQVAMWIEIFIIKQYQRSECVVDARDKTRLFLNSFLEPEGQQIFIHSKLL